MSQRFSPGYNDPTPPSPTSTFTENKSKIQPKELPSCSYSMPRCLLITYTQQLESLVTALHVPRVPRRFYGIILEWNLGTVLSEGLEYM